MRLTVLPPFALFLIAALPAAFGAESSPTQQQPAQPPNGAAQAAVQPQSGLPPLPPLPDVGNMAIEQKLPLTPDQIRQLRRRLDAVQRATAEAPHVPPKPRLGQVLVDLSPGATPPVVRVAAGHGAVITFLDSTGSPWPVVAAENAAKDSFSLAQAVPGSSTISLNAESNYGNGSMTVYLKDLPTPITLTMLSGQPVVDYRLDVRVPLPGPNAKPSPVPVKPIPDVSFDTRLADVLDGTPPASLKPLVIAGLQGQAWRDGNQMFLRTRMTLLSPAPTQVTSSQDGTKAYGMDWTPVIVLSDDGKPVTLKVGE